MGRRCGLPCGGGENMQHDIEPVDKIGSMALIRQEESDIDCNVFRHIGRELRQGMIWASSGVA